MARKHKTHDIEKAPVARRAPEQQLIERASTEHARPLSPAVALERAAKSHPSAIRPADVRVLQRTVGNRAVQRIFSNRTQAILPKASTSENAVQRKTEEEEPLQAKLETGRGKENRTGLPDNLKAGIERLSGTGMDDVKVHYNSSKPAQVQALAYTQGTDIHLGPGREEHLPHEAWHVVQQKQGRVRPTMQLKDLAINDDEALEKEAGVMGALAQTAQALQRKGTAQLSDNSSVSNKFSPLPTIQRSPFDQALDHHHIAGSGGYTQKKSQGLLFNGSAADLLVATKVAKQASMLDAVKYAAVRFATIGNLAARIQAAGGVLNGTLNPRNGNGLEPFVYQITVPYKQDGADKEIGLWYQYAVGTPGYIIKEYQTDEGESNMAAAHVTNPTQAGYAPTFFSTHADTGATPLSTLVTQNPKLTRAQNEQRLDARTKLAGEGARFDVVKNNMDRIANDSRIYTIKAGKVYWVEFRKLWLNWAGVFNSGYGITDSTIAHNLLGVGWVAPGVAITPLKKFKPEVKDIEVKE